MNRPIRKPVNRSFALAFLLGAVAVFCLVAGLACAATGSGSEPGGTVLNVDFSQVAEGEYTSAALEQQWGEIGWDTLDDRAHVVRAAGAEHGRALRILYPKGSVGSEQGGAQFLVKLRPAAEYWLSYRVCFEPGFDFRLGGKLPGLTSGGSKYTGGRSAQKGDGWSARYMWRQNGNAVIYLYHADMSDKYGDDLPLAGVTFVPGTWYQLTQHIKVNSPKLADGTLEVWSGMTRVLARSDIRFRRGGKGLVDSFYFSTFHGGDGAEWAPEVDCAALFADFRISTEPPAFLAPFLTK